MEEAGEDTSFSASFTLLRLARDLKVNLPSRGLPENVVLRIRCSKMNFMLSITGTLSNTEELLTAI
jgi:hypothetical protein